MVDNENGRGSLVDEALLFSGRMGNAVFEIEELNGTIILKGTVESEKDKFRAEALAQEQEGVVEVVNRLKVSGF